MAKAPTSSGRDSDHATAIAILYVDEWESIQRQHEPVHIVPMPTLLLMTEIEGRGVSMRDRSVFVRDL